jgi:hypothetical protein
MALSTPVRIRKNYTHYAWMSMKFVEARGVPAKTGMKETLSQHRLQRSGEILVELLSALCY